MTALAAAMKKAGIVDPLDALREIADDVIASTTNLSEAREAFLSRVVANPRLVRALFARWEKQAADEYLSAAARRRGETDRNGNAEKADRAVSVRPNLAPSNIVPVSSHLRSKAGTVQATPLSMVTRTPTVARDPETVRRAAVAARAPEIRNFLETFHVNGKRLKDVTASEARAWSRSHKRDARFVEMVAEGVPDGMLIGAARTVEEVAALYERANKGE